MPIIQLKCQVCSTPFGVKPYRKDTAKYCSYICMAASKKGKTWKKRYVTLKGSRHHQWKGGRVVNSQGYRLIYAPNHPNRDSSNKVREHHKPQ